MLINLWGFFWSGASVALLLLAFEHDRYELLGALLVTGWFALIPIVSAQMLPPPYGLRQLLWAVLADVAGVVVGMMLTAIIATRRES